MSEPFNEGFIVRYLLGDLSEQEQIAVEDRAFSDAQCMQNVLAVEADLIDEYVRGGLDEAQRRLFEARFMASSERRQKVEFARALAKMAAESVGAKAISRPGVLLAPPRWGNSLIGSLRRGILAVRFSLAAACPVLLIGASWLAVQTIRLRRELGQLQADQRAPLREQQTLEQQFIDERALSQGLTARLELEERQRERKEELTREAERERDESAHPTIVSFTLLAGASRSTGSLPKLVVPRSARVVSFQIGIESGDEYESFRVELRTNVGRQIWIQDHLAARAGAAGETVVLKAPARLLSVGQYELDLKGVTGDGKLEAIGAYYFEALKE